MLLGILRNRSTTCSTKSSLLITIFIPWPPKTYEGLTNIGKSNSSAKASASSADSATPNSGKGILFSFNRVEKLPLSSAKSSDSKLVPIILTPYLVSFSANLRAVWPPNWTMTPSGFSCLIMS